MRQEFAPRISRDCLYFKTKAGDKKKLGKKTFDQADPAARFSLICEKGGV
jgi:hypothetical protein